MKTVIHINQHVIKANRKNGTSNPVITCKTYKENKRGNRVLILGDDGILVATVVYQPEQPLSCGAVCWIETENQVLVSK